MSSFIVPSLLVGLLSLALAACGLGSPGVSQPTEPASTARPATAAPVVAPPAQATAATSQPASATVVPPVKPPAIAVPPPPAGPQRIAFEPGATSGGVDGAIVRGSEQRYVLGARAGQLMRVRIGALEHNAVFTLFDPAGQPLAGTEPGRDATDWSGTLPANGDYQIAVGATRGNASFRLDVAIADPRPRDQSIRSVDWNAVIAADPALEIGQIESRVYVAVRGANPGVGGHPLLDGIIYVDMDSDGAEEAVIPLHSGGTAGTIGFLVYRQAAVTPRLTAWQDGYKLGLETEAGRLVVRNALYAGWEPNCCPSGFSFDTYTLQSGQLHLVAHREEGFAEMRVAAVERFYELLGQKDLKGAYAMLAEAEQAANPYEAWASGYANTLSMQATVTADPSAPNTVQVALTATDSTSDGGQVTRRFTGTWELVWAGAGHGWVLTHPNMHQVQ